MIYFQIVITDFRYSRLPCIRGERKITGFRVQTFIDKTHRKRI